MYQTQTCTVGNCPPGELSGYVIKHYSLRKIYEYASELRIFFAFSHSKTAISFNILLVLMILCLRYIYFQVSNYICIYIYNKCSFLYGTICINDSIHRQNTNIVKNLYMRASGASELRRFWHFYIIKVLFLSIWMGRNNHLPINILKHILRMHKHDICGEISIYTRAILAI